MGRIFEVVKTFFKGQNKRKLIENTAIVIIIGAIAIIAGGTFFNNGPKDNKSVVEPESDEVQEAGKVLTTEEKLEIEEQMEAILSQIAGAGKVDVMVTYASTKEIVPAYETKKDENNTDEKDSGGGTRKIDQNKYENKIVLQDENGTKKPVILKELQPAVKGVVVVAEGAAEISVKESLIKAVQVLVDVPVHKVQVFERKK